MSQAWNQNDWALEEGNVLAELGDLRTAADEAARHVRQLYFTFLLLAFYVAVIVFSTDDEQLLKGTGAHLPLLNVDLPLLGFYVVVPLLVLIFHVHLLNQFFLLSRKLFNLDAALKSLPPAPEFIQRELSFPLSFSYWILGTHHSRPIQWAFRIVVIVLILVVPIVLLLTIQWKFLPYHSGWITLVHQTVITLDLFLLWFFLPRLSSPPSKRWDISQHWTLDWGFMLTTLLLVGVWAFLVPPHTGIEDERLIGYRPWLDKWLHRNLELRERTLMRKEPPVELLYEAYRETQEGQDRVWREAGEALDLRGRNLRYADFSQSRLWDADLRDAELQGAKLEETQLQGADLSWAELQGADLSGARLQGAGLSRAQLQGADLAGTQLQGANLEEAQLQSAGLSGAQLQDAGLSRAQLQGAVLSRVQMQGANLEEAELQGAVLYEAQLQGAILSRAQLQGAILSRAQLQGTVLSKAQMQGAVLSRAQLQGANLRQTQLQGAKLWRAHLQGADFLEARLQGADLNQTVVYGTGLQRAELSLADLRGLCSLPLEWKVSVESQPKLWWEPFSAIEELEARPEREGERRTRKGQERIKGAIDRFWSIAFDLPLESTAISPPRNLDLMYDQQGLLAAWPSPPDTAELEQQRAGYLARLACNDQYIAKSMQWQTIWADPESESAKALQKALKDKAESGDCPVLAQVLAEEDQ